MTSQKPPRKAKLFNRTYEFMFLLSILTLVLFGYLFVGYYDLLQNYQIAVPPHSPNKVFYTIEYFNRQKELISMGSSLLGIVVNIVVAMYIGLTFTKQSENFDIINSNSILEIYLKKVQLFPIATESIIKQLCDYLPLDQYDPLEEEEIRSKLQNLIYRLHFNFRTLLDIHREVSEHTILDDLSKGTIHFSIRESVIGQVKTTNQLMAGQLNKVLQNHEVDYFKEQIREPLLAVVGMRKEDLLKGSLI